MAYASKLFRCNISTVWVRVLRVTAAVALGWLLGVYMCHLLTVLDVSESGPKIFRDRIIFLTLIPRNQLP